MGAREPVLDGAVEGDEAPPPRAAEIGPLVNTPPETDIRAVQAVLNVRIDIRQHPVDAVAPGQADGENVSLLGQGGKGRKQLTQGGCQLLVGVELEHPGTARQVLQRVALGREIAGEGAGGDPHGAGGIAGDGGGNRRAVGGVDEDHHVAGPGRMCPSALSVVGWIARPEPARPRS